MKPFERISQRKSNDERLRRYMGREAARRDTARYGREHVVNFLQILLANDGQSWYAQGYQENHLGV